MYAEKKAESMAYPKKVNGEVAESCEKINSKWLRNGETTALTTHLSHGTVKRHLNFLTAG